ncbi:MATE family efflux transporter [Levilactobacillus suantsaii]|uniref:Multidrug export protein MepA n=1 Tax=Levilactobacillus suantsaii TaxID=2292255 RepID=A0A4Q0VK76_9LACO|nr:MATE family efflux transporter [Levilactobacillus suantsaii]RXI79130.1 MATE family efflux transporter [Levilactobacillus suantsaii]
MEDLFEKAPVHRAYFTLAMPVVLSMLASMIYNLADTFFVSMTQNTALVAGVSLCTPLFNLMIALGDIFGLGGSAYVSRLLGQHNYELARRVSSFCFYGVLFAGIAVAVLMLVFERPVLTLMGATATTYPYAAQFYRIFNVGAALVALSIVPGNLMRTEGRAKENMIGSVGGIIVSIALDPILILSLKLGAAGAALANVIGFVLTDLILVYFVRRRCQIVNVNWHESRLHKADIWQILVIGVPASVTNLMVSYQTALFNNYLARYGADRVAALGIALKVYQVVNAIMIGFAFGAQPLIGYSYGANDKPRLQKVIRFDLMVEVVWSLVMASLMIIVSPWLVSLFLKNPAVIHYGGQLLRILLVTTPFVGAILVYTTVFQSTAKALNAFIMSISRQGIIFTVAIVVGNLLFGYTGTIWSQAIADVLTALLGWGLYRHQVARANRAVTES